MATPKSPTAAEALAAPVEFVHNDVTYSVLPSSEWSYETLVAFENGKITGFLANVLGEEQHDAFRATRPLVRDVNVFVEAIQGALGISGN